MTDADDPIRRGDAEALIRMEFPCRCADLPETNDGLPNDDVPCDGCFSSMALRAHLRALPADPVAEAAGKLAEVVKPPRKSSMVNGYSWCAICQRAVSEESVPPRLHAAGCEWVAYRAAVAARDAETVPPAPKPEEVDRIARKAFEDYAAGRTDSRGNPKPAPACARCDCIDGYVPSQPDGEPEPCPACRGKP